MTPAEITAWLKTLPKGSKVYIDVGGLTLRCFEEPESRLEIGGHDFNEDVE